MLNKEILLRMDRLIEIGESMQSSKVEAMEDKLAELHDWHTKSEAKTENTSDTMKWIWRLGPMLVAMTVMFAELKYLAK